MSFNSGETIAEALSPQGLRKTIALVLFFLFTTMPTVIMWQNEPVNPQPSQTPLGLQSGFGPRGFQGGSRFGHSSMSSRAGSGPLSQQSGSRTFWNVLSSFAQLCLATVGGAFALALYHPRPGFKRFALLCGPILGFGTMFTLGLYLAARTEVYRFEICFAALVGAMPGLLLYLMLIYWKASRLENELAPIESVEPIRPGSPYQFPHR